MAFLRLEQVPVKGKRVFIRSDLNVPLDEQGNITEDTRIRSSLPAIRYALQQGAAQVMVTSHLGRPKEGALTAADSLIKVGERMQSLLGTPVRLVQGWVEHAPPSQPGTVLLLENCRGNVGEKKNSDELSRKMASLCDVWVHDAFGTSHRAEATTYGMGLYASIACAGPLLAAELDALGHALKNPSRPLVAIVGGSKVSSKLTILSNLAAKVDHLVLGGGIANTFMLAAGLSIGKSLAEPELVGQARDITNKMVSKGAKVWLPLDVVCATQFAADAIATVKSAANVAPADLILDVGPETAEALATMLQEAGTIVWNGPLGVFEFTPFADGTKTLALAIARSPAFSIAGGGDTLAAIAAYHVASDISYISTGGGAFLEFLEGKQLPAVEVLERRGNQ